MTTSARRGSALARVQPWNARVGTHKDAIVNHASPLGRTKRAAAAGVADSTNTITAFTIVQTHSHEAAARMFENHPHFTLCLGEAVESVPSLPIPGM
jgi:hypothetical protein